MELSRGDRRGVLVGVWLRKWVSVAAWRGMAGMDGWMDRREWRFWEMPGGGELLRVERMKKGRKEENKQASRHRASRLGGHPELQVE